MRISVFGALACAAYLAVFPTNAWAAADPFAAMLMNRGIEAFSTASAHGDSAKMDALVVDDMLFSAGDGTVSSDPQRERHDSIARSIGAQTAALLSASRHGDLTAERRYLDATFLSIDRDGNVSERRVLPPGPSGATAQWKVRRAGDAVVTSRVNGSSLTLDTWIRRGTAWKLMATHAIPLYTDPPAITLPDATLDGYAGAYTAGPGLTIEIARTPGGLVSSTNDAKPAPLLAEAPDVFFTPGASPGTPRSHNAFKRDAAGRVTGFVTRTGILLTKIDPSAATAPPAAGAGITSSIAPAAHLIVHHSGDVAVATFVHRRTTNYDGQIVVTAYRSTETWIKNGSGWKMLALQSREL